MDDTFIELDATLIRPTLQQLQATNSIDSWREFDWLLADHLGQVALVCTAGFGPAAQELLELSTDDRNLYSAKVSELPDLLPALGDPRVEPPGMGNDLETPRYGACGLFVYDWANSSGPYTRVLVPPAAIDVQDVFPLLGHFQGTLRFVPYSFSDVRILRL